MMVIAATEERFCLVCGKRFSGYERSRGDWAEVRYCSQPCHERRLLPSDRRLEAAIEMLLAWREGKSSGATLEPEEAARFVDRLGWRSLMDATHMAARRLAVWDRVEFLQDGEVVDPDLVEGPIQLRRKR